MGPLVRAQEPFRFFTRLNLAELTGLRASTLGQLLKLTKSVSGSCIYYHTHRFLQQHQYLSPEPPNDFAYWVTEIIGEDELGEQLASIDTIRFSDIRSLREEIIHTIDRYLKKKPAAKMRFASEGEEFHFIKAVSFILPTPYQAYDLKEFAEILQKVTIDSVYFHIFEARLRLEQETNDFSLWLEHALNEKALAAEISRFDPYTHTLESLRRHLVRILRERLH